LKHLRDPWEHPQLRNPTKKAFAFPSQEVAYCDLSRKQAGKMGIGGGEAIALNAEC